MNQIFTIFFYLSRWRSSIIFLCHGAFWEDFREFQAENYNFKQATLFFLKNWVLMFKRVFRAKYALFCDFFDVRSFFIKRKADLSENRANFLLRRSVFKILVRQNSVFFDVFSMFRVQLANPVKPDFLKTTVRGVGCYRLTKYAVTSPYMKENIVNFSKKGQKTPIFWRFSNLEFDLQRPPLFWPVTSRITIFCIEFALVELQIPQGIQKCIVL